MPSTQPDPAENRRILGLIPARAGSKGLPGKNIKSLQGHPLISHAVTFGLNSPLVDLVYCSTDSQEFLDIAVSYGATSTGLRPSRLAADDTPMLTVMQHALDAAKGGLGFQATHLLLLDPTSPGRKNEDLNQMVDKLSSDQTADGIVSVSVLEPNPIWYGVIEKDGVMTDLVPEGKNYTRRQDVPPVYKINGLLYLWKADFLINTNNWRDGKLLLHVTDPSRDHNIDTPEDFAKLESDLNSGITTLETKPKVL